VLVAGLCQTEIENLQSNIPTGKQVSAQKICLLKPYAINWIEIC